MKVKNLQDKFLQDENIAESTLKTYIFNLNKIKKHMPEYSVLKDKAKIKRYILTNELFNNYPYIYFNILFKICKNYYGNFHNVTLYYNKLLKKHHNQDKNNNQLTDKEKELWVNYPKLLSIINNVDYKSIEKIKDLRNYLLISLYILNPPRRLIYRNMINIFKKQNINKLDDKYNYIYYPDKILIINNHKSKKSIGRQIIEIDDKLMKIINLYNKRTGKKNKYLLGDNPIKAPNLTRLLKSISKIYFGKPLSASMFRKIYTTYKHKGTFKNIEDINKLGHSISTSSRYYNKNIENEV